MRRVPFLALAVGLLLPASGSAATLTINDLMDNIVFTATGFDFAPLSLTYTPVGGNETTTELQD